MSAPVDELFRGLPDAVALRADSDDSGSYMHGHFSKFDAWYEIDSWYEGRFIERTVPGSFKRTMNTHRDTLVVQFDHGYDLNVGDSPLGPIEELREDDEGAFYGVPLLDTDYNRDRILPLLQGRTIDGRLLGSQLGASFRFRVTDEDWHEPKRATDHNPEMLKERTIRGVRLYEFGPVVFPASRAATAAARSLSDHYIARRLQREGRAERAARDLAPHLGAPGSTTAPETPTGPAQSHPVGSPNAADLRTFLALNGR